MPRTEAVLSGIQDGIVVIVVHDVAEDDVFKNFRAHRCN